MTLFLLLAIIIITTRKNMKEVYCDKHGTFSQLLWQKRRRLYFCFVKPKMGRHWERCPSLFCHTMVPYCYMFK